MPSANLEHRVTLARWYVRALRPKLARAVEDGRIAARDAWRLDRQMAALVTGSQAAASAVPAGAARDRGSGR